MHGGGGGGGGGKRLGLSAGINMIPQLNQHFVLIRDRQTLHRNIS